MCSKRCLGKLRGRENVRGSMLSSSGDAGLDRGTCRDRDRLRVFQQYHKYSKHCQLWSTKSRTLVRWHSSNETSIKIFARLSSTHCPLILCTTDIEKQEYPQHVCPSEVQDPGKDDQAIALYELRYRMTHPYAALLRPYSNISYSLSASTATMRVSLVASRRLNLSCMLWA